MLSNPVHVLIQKHLHMTTYEQTVNLIVYARKTLYNDDLHTLNTPCSYRDESQTNRDRNITRLTELMIMNRFSNNFSGYYMYVQYKMGQKLSLFIIALTFILPTYFHSFCHMIHCRKFASVGCVVSPPNLVSLLCFIHRWYKDILVHRCTSPMNKTTRPFCNYTT